MKVVQADYHSGPIVWAGILASTCVTLFLFQKVLWLVVPFVLALLIYYALLPLKLRLVMVGLSHDAAAGLVSGAAFLVFALALFLALPKLVTEASSWQERAMHYVDGGMNLLIGTLKGLEGRISILAQAHISDQLVQHVADATDGVAQKYLASTAVTIAEWASFLVLAPFLAFFMLRDGWRFNKFLGRAVPNAFFERTLYLFDQIDRTARLYFLGLLQLTMLDTLCLAAGLSLLGISGALTLGLVTAVLAWIPYVGSISGCILVVLVAATDFPGNPAIAYGAVVLFLIVRLLDDFIFMPLTIGRSLNIHPLLTVVMIFVGGAVAGVPGLMMVLPVLGVTMVLGETIGMVLTDRRLQARHTHAKDLLRQAVTVDLRR